MFAIEFEYDGMTYDIRFRREVSKKNVTTNPTVFDTVCIVAVDGDRRYLAMACQSEKDRYDKWAGRKLALTRAIKTERLPKHVRRVIWDGFNSVRAEAKNRTGNL